MFVLQLLIGVFVAFGVGFILADVMKIPSLKASKAASNLGRKGNKKTSAIELYLQDFSAKIAENLKLNEFKKANLVIDLRTAGLDITPEQYIADAIVKALVFAVLAIPTFFISKIVGVGLLGVAVFMYFHESKSVSRKIKVKRDNIEYELPRFVAHIDKTLMHSRDLIYVIESYLPVAGEELKDELMITVAEMRSSGNNQEALTALDNRIGSNSLSDVARALKAVENSKDTAVLWASLAMKFSEMQKINLKAQANAIPRKVKKLSLALMMCFLMIYIAVIGQVLLNSMSTIF